MLCSQSEWISEADDWAGVQSIIKIERERYVGQEKTLQKETQYYISSCPVDPQYIAESIRSHWQVENKVHWVLDVTFKEDGSRIRLGDGAENVAVIRRFALNLTRLHPKKAVCVLKSSKQAGMTTCGPKLFLVNTRAC